MNESPPEAEPRLTTPSLLHGISTGDDGNWARFVAIYSPLVRKWLRRFGFDAASTEDIEQAVFEAAVTNLARYRHSSDRPGSMRAWLWGITRNKACDEIDRRSRQPGVSGGTTVVLQISQIPDRPFEDEAAATCDTVRKELAIRAMELIKTDFQEITWRAFWRTVIDGSTTKDVADELNMKPNAVRQARFRVLRHLRAELGSDLPLTSSLVSPPESP